MRGRNNCIPQIDGVIGERLPAMGASKELIRTIKKKKYKGIQDQIGTRQVKALLFPLPSFSP